MGKKLINRYKQGAVSLYVVIFATLLIGVITVSFIRIMVSNQRQTTNADLSQSAYDSAMAGVEDAKIALLKFTQQCADSGGIESTDPVCQTLAGHLDGEDCNAIYGIAEIGAKDQETPVQQSDSASNNQLNQAYTCVTIDPNPTDYAATAQPGESILIPISLLSDQQGSLSKIRLSWFTQSDNNGGLDLSTASVNDVALQAPTSTGQLFDQAGWDNRKTGTGYYPSLMRVQVIQVDKGGFSASDFGQNNKARQNTMFLYPSTFQQAKTDLGDYSLVAASAPIAVKCLNNYKSGETYACTVDIGVPGSDTMLTYVRLTGFYHPATFSLAPLDSSGKALNFNGVQSVVDSNGRANDLFRRVEARVELRSGVDLYPEFAVDLGGSGGSGDGQFCKNYIITDTASTSQGC